MLSREKFRATMPRVSPSKIFAFKPLRGFVLSSGSKASARRSAIAARARVISLALLAYLLTLVEGEAAGRADAAYGGFCIVAAILRLRVFEGHRRDRCDVTRGLVCLPGGALIADLCRYPSKTAA